MTLIFEPDSSQNLPSGRESNDDTRLEKWRLVMNNGISSIVQALSRLLPTRYVAALNGEVFILVRKHWGQVRMWTIPLPLWTRAEQGGDSSGDPLTYLIRRWSRLSILGRMPTPRRVVWLVDSAFCVSVSDHALPDVNPHKMRLRVKKLSASIVPCDLDMTFWSFTHSRENHTTQVETVSLAMIEVPRALMAVMGGEIDQVLVSSRDADQWQKGLPIKLVRRAIHWHPLAQQALIGLFDESMFLKRRADAWLHLDLYKIGKIVIAGLVVLALYFSLGVLNKVIEQGFFPRARQADLELADVQQQKIVTSNVLARQFSRDQKLLQQQKNQTQRDQRTQRQSQMMDDVVALWSSIPIHSQVEFLRWERGRLTVQLLTRDVAEIERWRQNWLKQNQEHSPNMQKIHLRQIQKDRDAQWRVTVFLAS